MRLITSPGERALIRRAAEGTDAALRAALAAAGEGVADTEIAAAAVAELIRAGTAALTIYPMIAVGYRTGIPHHSHVGVRANVCDLVFLEFPPAVHWYHAPRMHTAAIGEPPTFARELADVRGAATGRPRERGRAGRK